MLGLIWLMIGGIGALLVIAVSLVYLSRSSAPVLLVSRDGQTMMEVTRIGVLAGQLVIKGRLMGALPATILLRPEEAWKGLGLISARVILALPALLLVGWWRCLRLNRQAKTEDRHVPSGDQS